MSATSMVLPLRQTPPLVVKRQGYVAVGAVTVRFQDWSQCRVVALSGAP